MQRPDFGRDADVRIPPPRLAHNIGVQFGFAERAMRQIRPQADVDNIQRLANVQVINMDMDDVDQWVDADVFLNRR